MIFTFVYFFLDICKKYMAILAMVCLLTFAFSVAALSLSKSQQNAVLARGWDSLSNNTRGDIQRAGDCCGFTDRKIPDYPSCENVSLMLDILLI